MDWIKLCGLPLTLLGAGLAPSVYAQVEDIEQLPAISPWSLDMAEKHCALSRRFGDETAPVLFELRQYAPGAPYIATILRQAPLTDNPDPKVHFGPLQDAPDIGRAETLEVDDYHGIRVTLFDHLGIHDAVDLAVEDLERDQGEEALVWLEVGRVFTEDFRLATGPMHGALSAMRDCQASLVGTWGLDAEQQRTLSSNAEVDFDDAWISDAIRRSSPRGMRDGRSATTNLLFVTDLAGSITQCRALSPHDDSDIAERFCELALEDGRVIPALDAAGQGAASTAIFGFFIMRSSTSSVYP